MRVTLICILKALAQQDVDVAGRQLRPPLAFSLKCLQMLATFCISSANVSESSRAAEEKLKFQEILI